jgi:hypothetical protein
MCINENLLVMRIAEYVSTDNPDRGTWFIQALCAEFKANWKSLEIIEMLTRVCRKLASVYESMPSAHKRKQLTAVTSTLTKALKFLQ